MELKNNDLWSSNDKKQLKKELFDNIDFNTIALNHGKTTNFIISKIKSMCYKMHLSNFTVDEIIEKTRLQKEVVENVIKTYKLKTPTNKKQNDTLNNCNMQNDNEYNDNIVNDNLQNNDTSNNEKHNDNMINDNLQNNDTSNNEMHNDNVVNDNLQNDEIQENNKIQNNKHVNDNVLNNELNNYKMQNNKLELQMIGKHYSQQECDEIINSLKNNETFEMIATKHKRTVFGIYCKITSICNNFRILQSNILNNLKLQNMGLDWSDDEFKKLLQELNSNISFEEIAKNHQRSILCIKYKIKQECYELFKKKQDLNYLVVLSKIPVDEIMEYIAKPKVKRNLEKSKNIKIIPSVSNILKTTTKPLCLARKPFSKITDNSLRHKLLWVSDEEKLLQKQLNENKTYEDISKIMGRSIGSIKSRASLLKKIDNVIKETKQLYENNIPISSLKSSENDTLSSANLENDMLKSSENETLSSSNLENDMLKSSKNETLSSTNLENNMLKSSENETLSSANLENNILQHTIFENDILPKSICKNNTLQNLALKNNMLNDIYEAKKTFQNIDTANDILEIKIQLKSTNDKLTLILNLLEHIIKNTN